MDKKRIFTFMSSSLKKTKFDGKISLTLEELFELSKTEPDLKPLSLEAMTQLIDTEVLAKIRELLIESNEHSSYQNNALGLSTVLMLVAALRQTSASSPYKSYVRRILSKVEKIDNTKNRLEELYNLLDKTLENSIGRGHNAAVDLVQFDISEIAPRAVTLYQTFYEMGVKMLQKSTRRVEHDTYLIPKTLEYARGDIENFLRSNLEDFNKLLSRAGDDINERKKLRQDAMYIQPLLLLTTNFVGFSLRSAWQMMLEAGVKSDKQGNLIIDKSLEVPTIIRDYAVMLFNTLRSVDPRFVKLWKTNYKQNQFWPSNSFYFSNRDLEKLIEERTNFKDDFVVLGHSNPFNWTSEDIPNLLKCIKGDDKEVLNNLKLMNIKYLMRVDLSLLHQLTRHRTLRKQVEPLRYAVKRAITNVLENNDFSDFHIPVLLKKEQDLFKKNYRNALLLIKELLDKNYPENDVILLVPHGLKVYTLMEEDGWNVYKTNADRLCMTAKPDIRVLMGEKKKAFERYELENGIAPLFSSLMIPKCAYIGECPDGITNCPKSSYIKFIE